MEKIIFWNKSCLKWKLINKFLISFILVGLTNRIPYPEDIILLKLA